MEAIARGLEAESTPLAANILLVSSRAGGGLARHVISLLAGLHQDGYRVGIASADEGPVADAARERSLRFYPIAIGGGPSPPRAAVAAVQVAGAVSQLQAQIVHTHSYAAGLIGALAAPLIRSARVVATIHNYPPGEDGMRAARTRHRWAMRQIVRRAARLITVSDALRSDLVALHPEAAEKTVTIANGIDVRAAAKCDPKQVRAAMDLPEGGALIGMIARLAPQKGIPEFIRACRVVADRRPGVAFVLAGDGPLMETATGLRDEMGLGDRLHLVGAIESAGDLIAALDCLVVASTSEGSSVVAMEAMAQEKPVVGTRVGGVPEVVVDGETGIIVEPGDPEALAEGVERVLADPDAAREMGERGRRRAAERFDVALMLERTKQVYADLLGATANPEGGAR